MSLFIACLLCFVPALPLVAGLVARSLPATGAGRVTLFAAGAAVVLAWANVVVLALSGPHTARWSVASPDAAFVFALRLDAVSAAMIVLITFLGTIVLRFSRRYLAGDSGQAGFFSWMSLTLSAVLLLVLSGHLLLLVVAWGATSLCLHRLLLHYPSRPGAVFSARKKFVFSRIGDVSLLAAVAVLYAHFRTFDLETIFAAIADGRTAGTGIAAGLLGVCALLKSAQFPFHSWLPDTMETPTPVSAFMHAGIINAGGFLVVRLSPIFSVAPTASHWLAIIGAITAAFGALVMLAQPSVKRALAYSTIAQMGFMMLQCGLGAYGLALLHICAHSCYKAHAFLTAGSTIGAVPRAALPLRTSALTIGVLGGGILVALGATLSHLIAPHHPAPAGIFAGLLVFAAAYVLARAWSAGGGAWVIAQGVAVAVVVTACSFGLHALAPWLFPHLPVTKPPRGVIVAVSIIFAGLFLAQSLLWRAGRYAWGRQLYVHVLNGFYVGTFLNHLLNRLWPRAPYAPTSPCPLPSLTSPLQRST